MKYDTVTARGLSREARRRRSESPYPIIAFIYTLSDPITLEVRYVGQTDAPSTRYSHHIGFHGGTKEKRSWVLQLREQGLRPLMVVIDDVYEGQSIHDAERFWHNHFQEHGCDLLNKDNHLS